jgi:vacuolar-type H+-ATPase subunit H
MRPRTAPAHTSHSAEDALTRLLLAESRLAERLNAAREAAEETLREAREDAQRIDDSCAATVESQRAALRARFQAQNESELAEVAHSSKLTAERYATVSETLLRDLVALVIERVLPVEQPQ